MNAEIKQENAPIAPSVASQKFYDGFLGNVKTFFTRMHQSFLEFFHHFKILREANISLGKYHLQKANFTDANLRFNIVDKFFAPKDPENLYWLGFTYIAQKNYIKALQVLQNNTHDKIGLGDYIANMSSVGQIPKEIAAEYDAVFNQVKYKRYFTDQVNLFEKFTSATLPHIPTKSWDSKYGPYTVLEVGAHPFWVEEVSRFFPHDSYVDTLNFDSEIFGIAKTYNSKTKIYRDIILKNDIDSSNLDGKYELVIAFDSFSRTTNLEASFKFVKSRLTDSGIFAFVLPKGDKVKIDPSMNHFVYSKNFISENLKLANMQCISITSLKITLSLEYFIVVAK
ncbi:MAG: hypothetical protein SFT91_05055 [Rickettsiaceae bacterium]|nr:hypothetical protein [Rickettsiaceae bacterium]